jgi:hypothetical protein
MRIQHNPPVFVRCPVCDSVQVAVDDDQDRTAWTLYALTLRCKACAATFTAHYECYAVAAVRYGNPIGPVFLTDVPQAALAAWEADDEQCILTDGTSYAVGYAPTLLDGGRMDDPRWQDTSPDELDALLAHG